MNQEIIDKLRRIYKESTNAVAKEGAKKKLQDAGVSLTAEEPKKETQKKTEPKASKPKSEPKEKSEPSKSEEPKEPKKSTKSADDTYCDELIAKEKERKAKAKASAEKRANAPKKTPSTKNKEAVEKTTSKVEKSVESRAKKGEVKVEELEKLIAEYQDAIKKLKELLAKVKSGKKFAEGGNMGMLDTEHAMEYHEIKEHSCGCGDKMADGGQIKLTRGKPLYEIEFYNEGEKEKAVAFKLNDAFYEIERGKHKGSLVHIGNVINPYGKSMAKGGNLKPIPKGNKGLPMLPKSVRNKMGFMKDGGEINGNYVVADVDYNIVGHFKTEQEAEKFAREMAEKNYDIYRWGTEEKILRHAKEDGYMAKGGAVGGEQITIVAEAIFYPNEKDGKIEISTKAPQPLGGLKYLIADLNSEYIASMIFESNQVNGKINTKFGEKTYGQLLALISHAKANRLDSVAYARGGGVKARKKVEIDNHYSALKEGKRVSEKYAYVDIRGGGTYKRRNANQYGKTKGGNVYYEHHENRVDSGRFLKDGGKVGISHYVIDGNVFVDYMDAYNYADKNNLPLSKIKKTKK